MAVGSAGEVEGVVAVEVDVLVGEREMCSISLVVITSPAARSSSRVHRPFASLSVVPGSTRPAMLKAR